MSRISALAGRASTALMRAGRRAGARFPIGVLALLAVTILANAQAADADFLIAGLSERLYPTLLAAGAASVLMRLAGESHGWRPFLLQAAPVAAALLAGLAIHYGRAPVLLPAPLLTALILAVPLAPYLRRPDGPRFWSFTLWTAVGMTLAFLSVLLFVVGVSAILEMVRFLFGIGLGSEAYEHIYVTAATLVGPVFALGRIPRDFDELPFAGGVDRLAASVQALVDFVAAPLVLASAIVIHLYAAKMAVLGEVPVNEIGWIASLYAFIVVALRITADPFLERGFGATRLFGRLWAAMLVVPLALLAYALALRVSGEGVTLQRFYLGLWTFAAALVVLAQLLPRLRGDIRIMYGVPLVLLAVTSVGPLGAPGLVASSQGPRIAAALGDRSEAGRAAQRTRLMAADEVGVLPWIAADLPGAEGEMLRTRLAQVPEGERYAAALEVLELNALDASEGGTGRRSFASSQNAPFAVGGYDLVTPELASGVQAAGQDRITLAVENGRLVIDFRGTRDGMALAPIIGRLTDAEFASAPQETKPVVVDATTEGGRHVRLRLVGAVVAADGTVEQVSATLALRSAEWPAASLGGG